MARFRGTLAGNRGPASRLGTAKSGLTVEANGWNVGVTAYIGPDADDTDAVTIQLTAGSNGSQSSKTLGVFTRADLDAMNADACTLPGCNGYHAPDSPRNHAAR